MKQQARAKTVMLRKISAQDAKLLEDLKASTYSPYSKIFLKTLRSYSIHLELIDTLRLENTELKEKLFKILDLLQQKKDAGTQLDDLLA